MDNSGKSLCPICWEELENPKLLLCRHTFCTTCLKRFVANSDGKDKLTCPLCRAVWDIPEGGVGRFMGNYFVDTKKVGPLEDGKLKQCDICKKYKDSEVQSCFHCGQDMCSLCKVSHEKVLMFSGISVPNSDSVYELNSLDFQQEDMETRRRRNSTEVIVPFHLQLSLDPMKSNKVVSLVSSFQIDIIDLDFDRHFISCVCPVSDTKCWVIPTAGPVIYLYDITGKLEKVIPVHGDRVRDIAYRQSDDCLLIAYLHTNRIFRYHNNRMTLLFTTGNKHPYGIDTFPDNRIAVVCTSENEDGEIDNGELHIYSNDGVLLKRIGKGKEKNVFKRPYSVVVNRISSRIFISDRGHECVFVLSKEGDKILHKYTGSRGRGTRLVFKIEHHFQPMNLAQDSDGNVLVVDAANEAIHLLNPEGIFHGLVLTNAHGNYGHALSIGVDPDGKIWIGDNDDKKVRIFRCISYSNFLDTDAYLPHLQRLQSGDS